MKTAINSSITFTMWIVAFLIREYNFFLQPPKLGRTYDFLWWINWEVTLRESPTKASWGLVTSARPPWCLWTTLCSQHPSGGTMCRERPGWQPGSTSRHENRHALDHSALDGPQKTELHGWPQAKLTEELPAESSPNHWPTELWVNAILLFWATKVV